jgi:hypothetical protein
MAFSFWRISAICPKSRRLSEEMVSSYPGNTEAPAGTRKSKSKRYGFGCKTKSCSPLAG